MPNLFNGNLMIQNMEVSGTSNQRKGEMEKISAKSERVDLEVDNLLKSMSWTRDDASQLFEAIDMFGAGDWQGMAVKVFQQTKTVSEIRAFMKEYYDLKEIKVHYYTLVVLDMHLMS